MFTVIYVVLLIGQSMKFVLCFLARSVSLLYLLSAGECGSCSVNNKFKEVITKSYFFPSTCPDHTVYYTCSLVSTLEVDT